VVRSFTSAASEASTELPPNVPDYWLAHPLPLTKKAGMNRFMWDLRYAPPQAIRHDYLISAMYEATPAVPQGALVVPGKYEVQLTVDGKSYRQPLTVALDPRVTAGQESLEQQFLLERKATEMVTLSYGFYHQAVALREAAAGDAKKLQNQDAATVTALKDFDMKVAEIQGSENRGGGGPPGAKPKPTFVLVNGEMGSLSTVIDSADAGPTTLMAGAWRDYCTDLSNLVTKWNALVTTDVAALNAQLAKQEISSLPAAAMTAPVCK
jgi:hypothetical protein